MDNGNATGTATITGSDPGTTNNLLYAPAYSYAGNNQMIPWTSLGTRLGDGNINFNGNGYFYFTVLGTAGGTQQLSTASNVQIADPSNAVYFDILETAVAKIQSLNLTGIAPQDIDDKWLPRSIDQVDLTAGPVCYIAPHGPEGQPLMLNQTEDIDYPVLVVLMDKQNQDFKANLNRNLLWRQRIRRLFIHQPLGTHNVGTAKLITKPVIEPNWFGSNVWGSSQLFMFTNAREPRTP